MNWDIPLLGIFIGIGVILLLLLKFNLKAELGRNRPFMLYSSLIVLYLLIGSPLKTLSHVLFSTHMIQMGILFFFVPQLILLGLPDKICERLNSMPSVFPLAALIVFSALFFLYHMPQTLPFLFEHTSIHQAFILLLFLPAFIMWIPIIDPVGKNKNSRYALWSGILITPACLLLIAGGLLDGTNMSPSPFLSQLAIQLCMPADQVDRLIPFKVNTRMDQIVGGILMMVLHKCSLMLAFHYKNRDIREGG